MSLINDMLRDLERRERNERPQGQRVLSAADPMLTRKRVRHFHILAMASVAVLLGLGALVQFERKDEFAITRQSVEPDSNGPGADGNAAVSALASFPGAPLDSGNLISPNSEAALAELAQSLPELPWATVPSGLKGKIEGVQVLAKPLDHAAPMTQEKAESVENVVAGSEAGARQAFAPADVTDMAASTTTVNQQAEAERLKKPEVRNTDGEAGAAEAKSRGKTRRALSFEERDRETSGAGSALAQRGQLLEAYDLLLAYLDDHPEAHLSRATLATILMAQQEFPQAASVLRQGLDLAPNYGAYKKLQARLLIRHGKAVEALNLLSEFPPRLEQDIEYHDLLATLYQQADQHEEALVIYQGLLGSKLGEGRWWAAKAISHEALGQRQEALASYQKASQSKALAPALRQYSNKRLQALSR